MSITAYARFTPRDQFGQFITAHITPAVRASVEAGAKMIEDRAKELCPVDTGALRDSISTEMDERDFSIQAKVAPHMPYAAYVEFGTGIRGAASAGAGKGPYSSTWPGQAAQPYMRPAVDESKEAIRDLFRGNLSTAIRSPYA